MHALLENVPRARDAVKGQELESALKRFGAFVLNQGLERTLAATTLHDHFDTFEGETLLDRIKVGAQEIDTEVIQVTDAAPYQPATWGFTPVGIRVVLSWRDDTTVDSQLMKAVTQAGRFLVRERLTAILAVMDRREPFPVAPDKILLERTDETARTQHTTVVERGTVPPERTAAWYFTVADDYDLRHMRGRIKPADVILVAMRGCDPGC